MLSGIRVLIVEDEFLVAAALSAAVEDAGGVIAETRARSTKSGR